MTYHGETRSLRSVAEVSILRLCLSRGLDARGCWLLQLRGVMPWWRRGSYATSCPHSELSSDISFTCACIGFVPSVSFISLPTCLYQVFDSPPGYLDPPAPARTRRQDFPLLARAWAISRLPIARVPHIVWPPAALKSLVLPTKDLSWVFVLSP